MTHDRLFPRDPIVPVLVSRLAGEFRQIPRRTVEVYVRGALADIDRPTVIERRRAAERMARRHLRAVIAPPARHAAPDPSPLGRLRDLATYPVRRLRNGAPRHRDPHAG